MRLSTPPFSPETTMVLGYGEAGPELGIVIDSVFENVWALAAVAANSSADSAKPIQGLNFYLPLIERVTFVRGRKLTSAVPLFPGYVFLAGNNEDGYAALTTRRVCQVIKVPDQTRLMEELEQIRSALSDGARLELYPHAVVGRRCRVVKGPFIGIEGMVTDRLGPGRLVMQVNIIGRGASLEIDADILEPV